MGSSAFGFVLRHFGLLFRLGSLRFYLWGGVDDFVLLEQELL